jgi:hypothetical protein
LFNQYKEKSAKTSFPKLESALVEICSGRFTALLGAAMGAFTQDAATNGRYVYEAESRHDWDAVLYRFYVLSSSECVSSNVL